MGKMKLIRTALVVLGVSVVVSQATLTLGYGSDPASSSERGALGSQSAFGGSGSPANNAFNGGGKFTFNPNPATGSPSDFIITSSSAGAVSSVTDIIDLRIIDDVCSIGDATNTTFAASTLESESNSTWHHASYSATIFVSEVPEPATIISGLLLLLPCAASTLRILRKRRVG
jgi:hypothetical protein